MNDPRKYAAVYAAIALGITLLSGFSAARLQGLGLEEAIYTVLAATLPAFALRVQEGFQDAKKPETITHMKAIDLLEETLARWSKTQAVPPSAADRGRIMESIEAQLAGDEPIDFDKDYHFAADGSGRHQGVAQGCTQCAGITIGQGS